MCEAMSVLASKQQVGALYAIGHFNLELGTLKTFMWHSSTVVMRFHPSRGLCKQNTHDVKPTHHRARLPISNVASVDYGRRYSCFQSQNPKVVFRMCTHLPKRNGGSPAPPNVGEVAISPELERRMREQARQAASIAKPHLPASLYPRTL